MIITKEQKIYRYTPDHIGLLGDADKKLNVILNCTYMTYMREDFDSGLIHYYSSNPYWQDIFIGQKLINDCAICSAGSQIGLNLGSTSIIPLVWNHIDHNISTTSKEINQLRESHNIANGIGLILVRDSVRESISFAGNKSDYEFYRRILANPEIIKSEIAKRRKHLLRV